jgi:hypothetical protein
LCRSPLLIPIPFLLLRFFQVDLDIRTLPLFAWDEKQAGNRKYLKYQHIYFFFLGPPLLMVLYKVLACNWVIKKRNKLEISMIIIQAITFFFVNIYILRFFTVSFRHCINIISLVARWLVYGILRYGWSYAGSGLAITWAGYLHPIITCIHC